MNIAIIGAGFAGLATAYFLLEKKVHVTFFDAQGIGAGASGISSGLLHPYPGLSAKRSAYATEALASTHALLAIAEAELGRPVADRSGILRVPQKEQVIAGDDIEQVEEKLFLIKSGATVYCTDYLEGLYRACVRRGAKLVIERIDDLRALDGYDAVVLAAGAGVRSFETGQTFDYLKGQTLCYKGTPPLEKSCISKGYLALHPGGFEIGSTYERGFTSEAPCLETAQRLLKPLVDRYETGEFVGVKAAVRVACRGTYIPCVQKLSDRLFLYTGLGSRGLLYHAFFAQKLVNIMIPT